MATYIFTQEHRDDLPWWNGTWLPQTVPSGARVQVQLPSDPIRWVPDPHCEPSNPAGVLPGWLVSLRATVTPGAPATLPDQGRISGTSTISVFGYRVSGTGLAAICLRPDPVPASPEVLGFPPGTPPFFVLTLLVGVPQLSIP